MQSMHVTYMIHTVDIAYLSMVAWDTHTQAYTNVHDPNIILDPHILRHLGSLTDENWVLLELIFLTPSYRD